MHGNISETCPVVGFGIGDFEPSGSTNGQLLDN